MIWNYSIDEIENGYAEKENNVICTICGEEYTKGNIYEIDGKLYDYNGAIKKHIELKHKNTADYLLNQETYLTGISEIQKNILRLILENKTDKEISAIVGIAQSTVRNHRFKLRERQKQAKLFLAMMNVIEAQTQTKIMISDMGQIDEIHTAATMVDDRYNITEKEREKTLENYMDENKKLKQFPAKEKKKIIILSEIMKNFKVNQEYSENEVNKVLKRIYEEDYSTIRRALIEYGFMDRSEDCRVYRAKQ